MSVLQGLVEVDMTEADLSYKNLGEGGAIIVAAWMSHKDKGALTSLHVGQKCTQNGIPAEEMRKIMAIAMRMDNMKILCTVPFKDKTLTELEVSGKNLGKEGALVVAGYLDGNVALSTFTFSGDSSPEGKPVTMETSMTKADFSAKGLGMSGAKMLSAFLPKCT
jgi:hypothetical protein